MHFAVNEGLLSQRPNQCSATFISIRSHEDHWNAAHQYTGAAKTKAQISFAKQSHIQTSSGVLHRLWGISLTTHQLRHSQPPGIILQPVDKNRGWQEIMRVS
eukprot:1151311-Pelagomonas_calceolata.AAC.1